MASVQTRAQRATVWFSSLSGFIFSSVRRVGDLLYAVHAVKISQRAAVRWYRIDATKNTLIQTGTIADPNLDLFFPSIAANETGTVVVGCNGSSSSTFVSCYAVVGETSNGSLNFGKLLLLKAGEASFQAPDFTGTTRWGDYSATSVDPSDPSRFWTIQAYPAGASTWATQITELITSSLTLSIAAATTDIQISWPASSGLQLHYSTDLSPLANWSRVPQTPLIANDQAMVSLPVAGNAGFFRLQRE